MKTTIYDLFNKDEQIKLLIENSEDIISIHDNEGNYLFYGGSAKYNFTTKEIIGKSPIDFFEKDDASKIIEQIKKTAQTGEKFETEVETNRYGKKRWFRIIISPLKKNGETISVIKICRDITERIKIQQEITQQKEFISNIINAIIHPLYVIDAETYNIVLANKATNINTKHNTNTCFAITHNFEKPCWENRINCPITVVKRTKMPSVSEHIHFDKNKKARIYQVHSFPVFNYKGIITYVVNYNIDITEKKNLEEALIIETEKAKESNRLKSAFLANISHEIRTPMNAILGFGELLKNEKLTVEKRNEFIDFINSGSNNLLEIIENILDIAKIDAKQLKIQMSKFRLIPFINEIYTSFNDQLSGKKELSLNCEIENDYIITDKKRLRQILINLISNAIKFTKEGIVKISCKITFNEQILFEVKDTGIGISEKDLPFVFDRFRQVGNETKPSFGGTGLGLAISKGFVKLMGGKISVKSEKGKGSTFSFTIPYKTFN